MFFLVCNLGLFKITEREPKKSGAVLKNHSKTINAKVVSFLSLFTKRRNQNPLQFWRVVNNINIWKTSKEVFWYSSAKPPKREAPGICPVCPTVSSAFRRGITPHATPLISTPFLHECWTIKERAPGFSGRPPRAVNRKIDTLGK